MKGNLIMLLIYEIYESYQKNLDPTKHKYQDAWFPLEKNVRDGMDVASFARDRHKMIKRSVPIYIG